MDEEFSGVIFEISKGKKVRIEDGIRSTNIRCKSKEYTGGISESELSDGEVSSEDCGTDYETDDEIVEEHISGKMTPRKGKMNLLYQVDATPVKRKSKRQLCVYEWKKRCSYCFDCVYTVCAVRVEKDDRNIVCEVTGDSPMKKEAMKHGVRFGSVSFRPSDPTRQSFLGRSCPSCSVAQGDFELHEILAEKTTDWLSENQILKCSLPSRLLGIFY